MSERAPVVDGGAARGAPGGALHLGAALRARHTARGIRRAAGVAGLPFAALGPRGAAAGSASPAPRDALAWRALGTPPPTEPVEGTAARAPAGEPAPPAEPLRWHALPEGPRGARALPPAVGEGEPGFRPLRAEDRDAHRATAAPGGTRRAEAWNDAPPPATPSPDLTLPELPGRLVPPAPSGGATEARGEARDAGEAGGPSAGAANEPILRFSGLPARLAPPVRGGDAGPAGGNAAESSRPGTSAAEHAHVLPGLPARLAPPAPGGGTAPAGADARESSRPGTTAAEHALAFPGLPARLAPPVRGDDAGPAVADAREGSRPGTTAAEHALAFRGLPSRLVPGWTRSAPQSEEGGWAPEQAPLPGAPSAARPEAVAGTVAEAPGERAAPGPTGSAPLVWSGPAAPLAGAAAAGATAAGAAGPEATPDAPGPFRPTLIHGMTHAVRTLERVVETRVGEERAARREEAAATRAVLAAETPPPPPPVDPTSDEVVRAILRKLESLDRDARFRTGRIR